MPYDSKNLSVLAYSNGFTLWHYKTTDTAATVDTVGYFNAASDMVRQGDMIMANTSTGSTFVNGIFAVDSNSNGVVDTRDLTVIGSADTD